MQELSFMWSIVKKTGTQHIIYTFVIYYFVFCLLIHFFDPEIQNFGDALWFGFNVITTIGLGDYTVTSFAGRILVMILGLYGIFFFALIPGILTSCYLEKMEQKKNTIINAHPELNDLNNLTEDQKKAIASTARKVNRHGTC